MERSNENCAVETGQMSVQCRLDIKELENTIKKSFQEDMEKLEEDVQNLRYKIRNLENQKADDDSLISIREKLIRLEEQISKVADDGAERKNDINRLGDQLNDLFKVINDYNYENGEVIAKVENFAEIQYEMSKVQKEMMEYLRNFKAPTASEQVEDWINRGNYPRIRKAIVFALLGFFGILMVSALTFYTGQGVTLPEILEFLKEII